MKKSAAIVVLLALFFVGAACAGDFSKIVAKIRPSVVGVRVLSPSAGEPLHLEVAIEGTGTIISADGFIMTSRHLVDAPPSFIVEVLFFGGDRYAPAKVVGLDRENDLALLKVDSPPARLSPARFAKRSPRVGEWIMKMGFIGLVDSDEPSFAVGIVSNRRAFLGEASTPYSVAGGLLFGPGDSGSPIINEKGKVVGIGNTLKKDAERGIAVPHYVPVEIIAKSLPNLRRGGIGTGWLGIYPANCASVRRFVRQPELLSTAKGFFLKEYKREFPDVSNFGGKGIVVMFIADPKGDAAKIRPGDIVLRLNGRAPRDKHEFMEWIAATPPGTKVNLEIVRDGAKMNLPLAVGEYVWRKPWAPADSQR